MLRYYVWERIILPEGAERPDSPETFDSIFSTRALGMASFGVRSKHYIGTRAFYVSSNRQQIELLVSDSVQKDDTETHRIWDCHAALKYLAAHAAFHKKGRLLFERLTNQDLEQKRREATAGEAMLVAADAGMSMENATLVRNTVLASLEGKVPKET